MTRRDVQMHNNKQLKLIKQDIKIMCTIIPVGDLRPLRFDKIITYVYKNTINNEKLKQKDALRWAATLYWLIRDYDPDIIGRFAICIYQYPVSDIDDKLYSELAEMMCYGLETKSQKILRKVLTFPK